MGIELHDTGRYNARCDGCDKLLFTSTWSANATQELIREQGWLKADYIKTAPHYVWLCPKCKGTTCESL